MHPVFIQPKLVSVLGRTETDPKLQQKQTWVLRQSNMATQEIEHKPFDPIFRTQGLSVIKC